MLAVVKIRLYSMQATVLIDLLPTAIDPFSNSFWIQFRSSNFRFSFLGWLAFRVSNFSVRLCARFCFDRFLLRLKSSRKWNFFNFVSLVCESFCVANKFDSQSLFAFCKFSACRNSNFRYFRYSRGKAIHTHTLLVVIDSNGRVYVSQTLRARWHTKKKK